MDIRLTIFLASLFISTVCTEYLGCYYHNLHRMLQGTSMTSLLQTPQKCIEHCKRQSYLYAGVQSLFFCYCGDESPIESEKVPTIDCSFRCPGDGREMCGGVLRNSVYKTGAVALKYEYVGCYDGTWDSGLKRASFTFMTPRMCINHCRNQRYTYAGLQSSKVCLCGNEEPKSWNKLSENYCNSICPGDLGSKCGGIFRRTISVYKVESETATTIARDLCVVTQTPAEPSANSSLQYVGCYLDDQNRKLTGKHEVYLQLTPKTCIDYCKRIGYDYAGLQYRTHCFCGNETPDALDRKSEDECNMNCPGDCKSNCGGNWRNCIYKTESINIKNESKPIECVNSVTTVNGQNVCAGAVVFEENFDSLSKNVWSHDARVPFNPDFLFVVYNSDPANSHVANGKLVLKPTLLEDSQVKRGHLNIESCTGNTSSWECGYKAVTFMILPPVQSARLTTRNSFNFRYGKVEITAKLPLGDWLVPELSLEPKNAEYGPGYKSGKIQLAISRGNKDLRSSGENIGCEMLESSVLMGIDDNVRTRTVIRINEDGWYKKYHNYTLLWTPDNITFSIDGEDPMALIPAEGGKLSDIIGFPPEYASTWASASKLAPFDKDFYITLGLYAGRIRDFPDFSLNDYKFKPWTNNDPKAMLNFWRDRDSWKSTWNNDLSSLQVDHIKVTAL